MGGLLFLLAKKKWLDHSRIQQQEKVASSPWENAKQTEKNKPGVRGKKNPQPIERLKRR